MNLPFTTAQFFDVFGRYNRAVFPMQAVTLACAIVIITLAAKRVGGRAVYILLAGLWVWMGAVYHLGFFRQINPVALVFGVAFIVQAIVFVFVGIRAPRIVIRPDLRGVVGVILAVYALLAYPAVAYALGQRYPEMPTFGLPCPTTIFTFAVLLWTTPSQRLWVYALPVLWAAVGTLAALQLSVLEDYALPVAAVSAVWLLTGRGSHAYA